MIVIMNDTVRKFLIQDNSMLPFEFEEPTPVSLILSSYILVSLRRRITERFDDFKIFPNSIHYDWIRRQTICTEEQTIYALEKLFMVCHSN
jgi:hypothetical protein